MPPPLAIVEVELDTKAPLVTVQADPSVDAPAVWNVVLRTNEDIGSAELDVFDAAGELHSVGFEQTDPRTLVLAIPTVMIAGPAHLVGWVSDQTCNKSMVDVTVQIIRTIPFDVVVTIGHPFGVDVTVNGAFDATSDIEHGLEVWKGIDHAFEVDSTIHHAFDVQETLS